jgi:integrase
MLSNIDATLREIVERAQLAPEAGHLHALRHTYCAARLQTLDNGVPVAGFTAAREMGHGGHSLVRRIYGHLGTVRHRADVVEYRVEQDAEKLAARLGALRGS